MRTSRRPKRSVAAIAPSAGATWSRAGATAQVPGRGRWLGRRRTAPAPVASSAPHARERRRRPATTATVPRSSIVALTDASRIAVCPFTSAARVRADDEPCAHVAVELSLRELPRRKKILRLGTLATGDDGTFAGAVVPAGVPLGDYDVSRRRPATRAAGQDELRDRGRGQNGRARRTCYQPAVSSSFHRFAGTPSYLTNESLEAAVNCALALERPLLVKGEPGTGKTLLAQAIAESTGLELIHWPVKSTTRAQDGLYVYDTVQRLYDARFGDGDVKDIRHYIKLGPLGRAFKSEQARGAPHRRGRQGGPRVPERSAPRARPDALRHHRDGRRGGRDAAPDRRSSRRTTRKSCPTRSSAGASSTSSTFPDQERMKRIVRVHHPNVDGALVDQAVVAFYELRAVPRLRKRPSTSELVDWITVLMQSDVGRERLVRELPFLGVLLKKEQDVELLKAMRSAGGSRR